ncbi:polysaccharide deacetylase family protein [Streptomyces mobaraensis]|uniref:Putative secreted protein n=1 Tax=Streptomyces mobaraensis (strain ATCC 29032 / DSM 40847 / JCM 4168 / NBRC 13819 / NCIMB 11159 / IPCR 16-22) TaxID=1223523 RepID=M2ZV20_STRM1|nr:polysaccharide deacetylase family protein [Streptomyces mobaraensis]EME96578.1 putative secreted protein [Streptomyces mobaraensis NBRC 13819 = DSM 40847]
MTPSGTGRSRTRARSRIRGSAPLALVPLCAAALLLSGCSSGSDGKKDGSGGTATGTAKAAEQPKEKRSAATPDPAAYRRWGLDKPLAPPPAPPATRLTEHHKGGTPQIVRRVPTKDKVVFLTFDDGAEKDPAFLRMAKDLKLPFSMFLTDSAARAGRGYGYFDELRALGNGVHNHTLTHPNLRTLSAEAQKREICGQQETLKKRFGKRPELFRPPYGNYNDATLAAAGSCGVKAVVLWEATMQINDMRYAEAGKLRPGDIVLAHFRGPAELKGTTMTQMVANMVRSVQRQGFTVARLEDYV